MAANIYKQELKELREQVRLLEARVLEFQNGTAYQELLRFNHSWHKRADKEAAKMLKERDLRKAAEAREQKANERIAKLEDAVWDLRDAHDPHANPPGPAFLEWVAERLVHVAGDPPMMSHIDALKRKAKAARRALEKTERVAAPRMLGLLRAYTKQPDDIARDAAAEHLEQVSAGYEPKPGLKVCNAKCCAKAGEFLGFGTTATCEKDCPCHR